TRDTRRLGRGRRGLLPRPADPAFPLPRDRGLVGQAVQFLGAHAGPRLGEANGRRDGPIARLREPGLLERPVDRLFEAVADRARVGALRHPQRERELVATRPRDRNGVALPQRAAERRGYGTERLVAGRVAHRVVEGLEVVQVDAEPSRPRARRTLAECLGRRPLVGATVREPGERILRRFPAELRADRLGDAAAESGEPPLARRPLLGDRTSTRLNSSHVKISYAVFRSKKQPTSTRSSGCPWI